MQLGLAHADADVCVQAVFFVETVSGSILRTGYFLRLYFWIDALATVSLGLEACLAPDLCSHTPHLAQYFSLHTP